ncbi:uncharacterized protein N7459_001884 [Penicillium hispanicum]|uniref:uncharacterized protein n=1 Tax=Penicillium hispanicum TaxID=1080232 RepID=UPI0025415B5B|nr:uncharacterized protein N7459_001884 [Penicillium hispanicum]KAJ5591515.1 hypothetical protein N7459_001884 [Penicillium hispanicum]
MPSSNSTSVHKRRVSQVSPSGSINSNVASKVKAAEGKLPDAIPDKAPGSLSTEMLPKPALKAEAKNEETQTTLAAGRTKASAISNASSASSSASNDSLPGLELDDDILDGEPQHSPASDAHEDGNEEGDDYDIDTDEEERAIWHARQKRTTARYVEAFLDASRDKHYVDIKLSPLTGPENYAEWIVGIKVLLRMHQVWEVVQETIVSLEPEDRLYPWFQRMRHTGVALIYAHISPEVRQHSCVLTAISEGNPNDLMHHIWAHFASPEADKDH